MYMTKFLSDHSVLTFLLSKTLTNWKRFFWWRTAFNQLWWKYFSHNEWSLVIWIYKLWKPGDGPQRCRASRQSVQVGCFYIFCIFSKSSILTFLLGTRRSPGQCLMWTFLLEVSLKQPCLVLCWDPPLLALSENRYLGSCFKYVSTFLNTVFQYFISCSWKLLSV